MALFHGPTSRHGRTRRGDAGGGSVAAAAMRPRASCGLRREGEEEMTGVCCLLGQQVNAGSRLRWVYKAGLAGTTRCRV